MPVDEVKSSSLLGAALAGRSSSTPIGQTNLTNDPSLNSENVRPISGIPLTEFDLSMFVAVGNQDKRILRNPNSDAVAYGRRANAPNITVDVTYDRVDGKLTFVALDQSVIDIDGFVTKITSGVGEQGDRGELGDDGYDGKDGRLGKKGFTGCVGPEGIQGPDGEPGIDGAMGIQGDEGPLGCDGNIGPTGDVGPAGRIGDDGPVGPTPPACLALAGEAGPDGEDANTRVVVQTETPSGNVLIWGDPS